MAKPKAVCEMCGGNGYVGHGKWRTPCPAPCCNARRRVFVRAQGVDLPALLPPIDFAALNPGVRRLVRVLREAGFDTCDSGDGATHDHECDRSYPYVVIRVRPAEMAEEARRLRKVLRAFGCAVDTAIGMDESEPAIQATYDPVNDIATIDLTGVTDAALTPKASE